MIEKYEIESKEKGLNLLVLAAVHGNETAGTNALYRLKDELDSGKIKLKRGKLTFVPVANPEAYRQDVRGVEENLNRVMKEWNEPKTYEQKIANEICPLIKENDVLLDLHSTHCVGDVPFAFCDYPNEYNKKLIDALAVGYVLEGWPDIYDSQGEIEDFSTERAAHIYGNTATTLECGFHKSSEAVELAYEAILCALKVFGMIEGEVKTYAKQHILMKNYVVKKRAGKLYQNFKHLDKVAKDEVLAVYEDGEVLRAPDDGYILLPFENAEVGGEWYYFGVAK